MERVSHHRAIAMNQRVKSIHCNWHALSYRPNKCVITHREGCLLHCLHPVPELEPAQEPALRAPKFLHGPSPTELGGETTTCPIKNHPNTPEGSKTVHSQLWLVHIN